MIGKLSEILKDAKDNNFAIGAFNTFDLESTEAIIQAAENEKSPVIIQISEKTIEYAGLEEIYTIIKELSEKSSISVVINLDHGKDEEVVRKCIDLGFASVMFDGSRLTYEENVKLTKELADYAHSKNVEIEAELGSVGAHGEDLETVKASYTDPDQALDFVQKTGIDALAIGCGTAHGLPLENEKINFDVIKNVADKVSVPLVLHGSSNIPDEDIKLAISAGISKINIDTELRQSFTDGIKESLKENSNQIDPRAYLGEAKQELKEKVQEKIRLFSNE
ncbi:MAG: class II fructose-bisphosphate aldolase [Patescibacteria group bacterium]|jgi:fructose-bisphosphate aldolase class II